jgi:hypothetical protein
MAKKKKKSKRKSTRKTVACKVVRIKGQGRRKICRDKLGRITSNKKAT